MSIPRTRLKGVVLTLVGVTVVSPDSLLIRLMQTDIWTVLFFRGALGGVTLYVISLLLERLTGVKGLRLTFVHDPRNTTHDDDSGS